MYYRFRLESILELKFACILTMMSEHRVFPEQPDLMELHFCECNESRSEYTVVMHLPGQEVPERKHPVPVKNICLCFKIKPDCFEHFSHSQERDNIQIMKQQFFLIPQLLKIDLTICPNMNRLFLEGQRNFKEGIKDQETAKKILRWMNYLSWSDLIPGGFPSYYVMKAYHFIRANAFQKITIDIISQELGISPNYLSRLFQENTGKTIKEVINIVRANAAREALYHSSLQEIETSFGFANKKSMNQIFLRLFQMDAQTCRNLDRESRSTPWNSEDGLFELLYK